MKPRYHKKSDKVSAKKSLGQHFLKSTDIARVIARGVHAEYRPVLMPDGSLDRLSAGSLSHDAAEFSASRPFNVLEIGPGMGILSGCLWEDPSLNVNLVEIDPESVVYLASHFPEKVGNGRLFPADFLKMELDTIFGGEEFILAGNFPYNISNQILFRVLENKARIPLVTGMFQKEVGERVCARPATKAYGILSVLLQAFYQTEYLFTVEPDEFLPPPQVRSCVIRLIRNGRDCLNCDEKMFTALVKKAFNQRRKTLRNALKTLEDENGIPLSRLPQDLLGKRAEELSVEDYVKITLCCQA